MSLTPSEEALVRQLLDQQAAILSLAGNEATITSKLGAAKVTLANLVAASSLADADLLLTRQGTTDKSVRADILAAYTAAELNLSALAPLDSPALTGTPTAPTATAGTNTTQIATTAFVRLSSPASLASNGYQKLPSGLIIQWGTTTAASTTFPLAFPTSLLHLDLKINDFNSNLASAGQYTNVLSSHSSGFTVSAAASILPSKLKWIAIGC